MADEGFGIDSLLSSSDEEEAEAENEVLMSKLYLENDIPWDLLIACAHPSVPKAIIVATADMGHALKKMRNAMHLSGKEGKARDLHFNNRPVNLRMAFETWQLTPDGNPDSTDVM